MFQRIVVILTILAVIACPMFCGSGSACCSDGHRGQAASASTPQMCSCCCHPTPSQPELPAKPLEKRSDKSCQGVCGGVVMLESVKIDSRDDLLYAVPFEIVSSADVLSDKPCFLLDEDASTTTSGGRSLRTLLSSFLC